jgi:hypothetical protein
VLALIGGGTTAAILLLAAKPQDTVTAYLEAVAGSRTDEALGYLAYPPSDRTFVNDAVLTASSQLGAITEITLADNGVSKQGDYASVTVSYTVGSTPVYQTFNLAKQEDKAWRITDNLPQVNLTDWMLYEVGMTINGVSVDDIEWYTDIPILPGTYRFAINHSLLKLADMKFTVGQSADTSSLPTSDMITLADTAAETLTTAAKAKLTTCLAAKEIDPAGCGFGGIILNDNGVIRTPDLSTIVYSLKSGNIDNPDWKLTLAALEVRASVSLEITISVTDTVGNKWVWKNPNYLNSMTVDISDPTSLTVTFK